MRSVSLMLSSSCLTLTASERLALKYSGMDSSVNWDLKEGTPPKMLAAEASQNSMKSINLESGLDCTDDCEEEILRDESASRNEIMLSPVFSRRKISGSFRLTPRLEGPVKLPQRIPVTKVDIDGFDLTTPHHSLNVNLGDDCPERPFKGRRSAITPAVEKSCRHLFTRDRIFSPSEESRANLSSEKQDDIGPSSKPLSPIAPLLDNSQKPESENNSQIHRGILPVEENCSLEKAICMPEDNLVPDPPFSSTPESVCSISSCDVSSCSSALSDLASPNLSEIKITKRTLESDSGDIEDLVVEEVVADAPELENQDLKTPEQQNNEVFLDPSTSSLVVNKPLLASGNMNEAESNFTSSVGSGPSNWTLVSGVSPLPSSDPTHLRHRHFIYGHPYHHHHHHNHHHRHHHRHHHHHHHHHHGRVRLHGNMRVKVNFNLSHSKMMITSTPNHTKSVQNNMDVSSIQTSKREDSFLPNCEVSRFVISSELQWSYDHPLESQNAATEVAEPDMPSLPPATLFSDKEDEEKDSSENTSASQELVFTDRKRQHSKEGISDEDKPCVKSLKQQGESSLPVIFNYDRLLKDAGRTPYTRRLTKEEARLLNAAPEHMTDDIWMELPSPRRCSSVDETLSRFVVLGSPLSTSLGNTK